MRWLCSYVECTSAAIQALKSFKKLYPGHRREEIERCIGKAAKFIEKMQASDGSWFALHSIVLNLSGLFVFSNFRMFSRMHDFQLY